jgi:molybdopterin molybdotransferase
MHHRTVDSYRDFAASAMGPIAVLPPLEMPITDVLGCLAAADVRAERRVPGFDVATCEGVAVRAVESLTASSDAPVALRLLDPVRPGSAPTEPVAEGTAVPVGPGSPLPVGADAVVPLEECRPHGEDRVELSVPAVPGQGFRAAGSEFAPQEVVVSGGQRLGHAAIAALAVCGLPRVQVHPRPRVVIVTIGSELVRVSDSPAEGLVHDATGVLLSTTARSLGADAFRVGPVPDDARLVRDILEDQLVRADIIVTAGGIAPPQDVLRAELEATGAARFDGPPLWPLASYGLGRIEAEGIPVVALPGEPAAALLGFHALVRPVLAAMFGQPPLGLQVQVEPGSPTGEGQEGDRGTVLVPGRYADGRFDPVAADAPRLRDLIGATAMTVHDAGATHAEVVVWPQ